MASRSHARSIGERWSSGIASASLTRASPHRLGLDAVPPRTGAGRELVVAVHDLDRPAIALLGELQAQLARARALLGGKPCAFVSPHAGAFFSLERLPGCGIDAATAPSVLDHEIRRRPGIERGQEIAGMAAKRGRQAAFFRHGQIVTLADV